MRGTHLNSRRSRLRAGGAGIVAGLLAASLAACGGGGSPQGSEEPSGDYPVKIVQASFPREQQPGQFTKLRIGVRNSGDKAIPALTISVSIAGPLGQTSSSPFTIHDPEPGLAQPDRPVWVLSEGYPRLAGSSETAGAQSANPKTFNFGRLKPGATREGVWLLTAARPGNYRLLYEVGAGLGADVHAVTAGGDPVKGALPARIDPMPPNTTVTDSGKVVVLHGKQGKPKQ